MYTEYEVRQLLEEAFEEGYDNGIDDTLDYIEENYELEDEFDLMDEYNEATAFLEDLSEKDKRRILRAGRYSRKMFGDKSEEETYQIAKARFNAPNKKAGKKAAKEKIKEIHASLSPDEIVNRRQHVQDVINKNGGPEKFEKRSEGFVNGKRSGRKMQF